jgi:hypothetical protein
LGLRDFLRDDFHEEKIMGKNKVYRPVSGWGWGIGAPQLSQR